MVGVDTEFKSPSENPGLRADGEHLGAKKWASFPFRQRLFHYCCSIMYDIVKKVLAYVRVHPLGLLARLYTIL